MRGVCSNVGPLNLGFKSAEFPEFDDFAKNQQLADEKVAEFDRGLWKAVAANSRDCLYLLLSYLTSHYHDGSFPYYQCKEKAFKVEIFNTAIFTVDKDYTEWFETDCNLLLSHINPF